MKIVSLLPSATELVFALGLGDQLEGVTFECDYPAEASTKPVVSTSTLTDGQLSAAQIDSAVRESMAVQQPLYRLDEQLISQVQPDVILTQDLCKVCAVPAGHVQDALDKLGCTAEVVSMDPLSLDDVLGSFVTAGSALGREDAAAELVAGLRTRIDAVKEGAKLLPTIRVLALEWSDPPWIGGHWIPQMVEIAGGTNLLNEKGKRSRTVTWKQVADEIPEVIVFMPCGYYLEEAEDEAKALFDQPEFAATPAAIEGAVFAVDATSYFSRPGPRIVDGLETLAWAIHPEAFPEPPEARITRIER